MRSRFGLATSLAVIALSSTLARADVIPQPVLQWGTFGSGPGQFQYNDGITIDENDVIYVADQQNNRIQKFDTNGAYLGEFGTFGRDPGYLFHPTGIEIAPDGDVYITEHQNHRISVWTRDGVFLRVIPFHDPADPAFTMSWPVGIDVDAAGNIYFTDYQGSYKVAPSGELLWRNNGGLPYGLSLGPDGLVYVSECSGDRISKYTTGGALVGSFGEFGHGPGQIWCAEGSVPDADGNLWVCDTGNDRIQKFSPTGAWLGLFYLDPPLPGQRVVPADVAFDSHGNLYVSRWYNHFIEKYAFGVPDNERPICSLAQALVERNWPANHQMEPVTIIGAFDPEGGPLTIRVTAITQDESIEGAGQDLRGENHEEARGARHCPDGEIHADGSASVRREREKNGNGRVYELTFVATDDRGATCQGAVRVCMPAQPESLCVNDGQTVNSLGPCARDAANEPIEAALETAFGDVQQLGSRVTLEYRTQGAEVQLAVFDLAGRRIATLFSGPQVVGTHKVEWSTTGIGRGVYFGRLASGGVTKSRMIVVR